jgi:hypothetical protein
MVSRQMLAADRLPVIADLVGERGGVRGEALVEVETEKLTLEVEAPAAGVLLRILAPDDTEVPVLSTIAAIGEPGEDISGLG